MHGAAGYNHPWPAQLVVLGYDDQVELGPSNAWVLDLRQESVPAAGAPYRQSRHRRVAAAGDHEIGPWRSKQRVAA
jgi:hypothetical protein